MTMMMMANHADPLDSSCTNTKYMSWVWRNGLQGGGGRDTGVTSCRRKETELFLCFFSTVGKSVCLKMTIIFELNLDDRDDGLEADWKRCPARPGTLRCEFESSWKLGSQALSQ